jgi:hypothetical protein
MQCRKRKRQQKNLKEKILKILDRRRDNLNPAPGSRNWGSDLGADAEFNFFNPPLAGEGRS